MWKTTAILYATSYMLSITTLNSLHTLTCYRYNSSLEADLFPSYEEKMCERCCEKLTSSLNLRFDPVNTRTQVVDLGIEPKEWSSYVTDRAFQVQWILECTHSIHSVTSSPLVITLCWPYAYYWSAPLQSRLLGGRLMTDSPLYTLPQSLTMSFTLQYSVSGLNLSEKNVSNHHRLQLVGNPSPWQLVSFLTNLLSMFLKEMEFCPSPVRSRLQVWKATNCLCVNLCHRLPMY